ncbi:acclimation of photosynthesis to environment [Striga hermonthica]|uniref:Acclimation of photosynthesis to environment n=1 Tax=Striga hermonthica TaxID=68872 RepID=A0A9N7MVQ7_STRHE|nr:acclimation of photosynthesis to environment [Striga hermonthica]
MLIVLSHPPHTHPTQLLDAAVMNSAVAEMAGGRIVPLSPPFISSGYTCCLLPLRRLSLASSGIRGSSLCSAFSARNRALFLSETLVECRVPRPRLVSAAAESTQSSSISPPTSADKSIVSDNEFSLAKVSFGVIGLGVGVSLLSNDVTRYRYGDEQHLDEALKRIFQYGQGGGIPRRSAPILQMIREEMTEDGRYSLILVFEAKALQLSEFEQRKAKFASFFGPGITAEIVEGDKNKYKVKLISNTPL